MARTGTKKTAARRPRTTPSSSSSSSSSSRSASAVETTDDATDSVTAPTVGGIHDLAGGLQSFLSAIETEVRAVTALSERIDGLVNELNAVREEQAQRLLALDALRGSASDGGLTSFLDRLIRPRQPRVPEVVPERLSQ